MLKALQPNNVFYSTKIAKLCIDSESVLASFKSQMCFTRKQEILDDQCQHPPYGTNLTYPLECYRRFCQTSGTTNVPLRWLDTLESWNWMLDCWSQIFSMSGVNSRDRILFAFSFGPFLGFWTAFEAATRLGCLCIPGGGLTSIARLHMILDNKISAVCCTPTYALRLAEVAREEGIDLSGSHVRKIVVAGESGGSVPAIRGRIETLWPGSQVVDHHGMTETGPASYQCPQQPGVLHLLESEYIAEIIDANGDGPATVGEIGELVLTNLGRLGSPLLRYRTGDLVKTAPEKRCKCGTFNLALHGGILGRIDDMITVRGVNVYPEAFDQVVRECEGVGEYRVLIQTERELTELNLEVEPSDKRVHPGTLADMLKKALASALGLRISISVVPAGSLPRYEMKARRWVRL